MEAFTDIDDAVAHATAQVEAGDPERAIYIAVPHARVHRAIRVDPIEPLPTEVPAQPDVPESAAAPGESQDVGSDTADATVAIAEHRESDKERDRKPIGALKTDLDALGSKLRRAQQNYDEAHARGDQERLDRFKLQKNAIAAELNQLTKYLSGRRTTDAPTTGAAE